MRSPALAIAWEFRQGHRFLLVALACYGLVLAVINLLFPGPWEPITLDTPNETAALVMVPVSMVFMYFLAIFSYGLGGDLAARKSIYPARMFTLPVTTAALAGWPMLYGAAAMAGLWLATLLFAVLPFGIDVPLIWPGLLGAVFLAWTQALMWMPYGLPGLRVIVAVLWLASLDAVVLLAIHYHAPQSLMILILAPQLPLAYLTACFAVARARRGDVPDWRGMFSQLRNISGVLPRRRVHFSSPAGAQVWFEWRRRGRRLPALVGLLLPFELSLLFVAGNDRYEIIFYTLFGVLLTPLFMAGFAAATVSNSNPDAHHSWGVTPFDATRPLTSAALIATQMKAAMWSTLAAWLLVVIAIPVALTLSSTWPAVIERATRWIHAEGMLRAFAIALLGFLGLLGLTWKQLVQNLYIGLTGREWVIKASVFLALWYLIIIGPFAGLIISLYVMAIISGVFPWVAAALFSFKVSVAAWIASRLNARRLLSARTLMTIAAFWVVIVLALYGLLAWLVTTPLIARFLLALAAVLVIPLARLFAAPLALAWNRHQSHSSTAMTTGKMVIRAVLVIGLPVVTVLVASVSYYFVNRTNGAIVSSGLKRQYLLYVPGSYDRSRPTPLVISMHGGAAWPAHQMNTSRWNRLADEHGFIVVYPAGSDVPMSWHVDRGAGLMRDVRFISELIDKLETSYNIDPERIYANGLSNGGGMAFVLSCTLSDRIAAVGMVAAAQSLPWNWCTDHRPVPMIAFHGTADALTPYNGGRSPAFPGSLVLPGIPAWTANWARRNQCGPDPIESRVAADVTRLEYTNCAGNAAVVLYTVEGGGHTWPGGKPMPEWLAGFTSKGVDATSRMWEFFREHRLSRK